MADTLQWVVTMIVECGLGLQAYRLVKALGVKVQVQDTRTTTLEGRVENHEVRIVKLENPAVLS